MNSLDKRQVQHAFNRAAPSYDDAAVVQRHMADELISRLEVFNIQPDCILDIGCGTGYARKALQRKFKDTYYIGVDFAEEMLSQARLDESSTGDVGFVCADAERLPIRDRSVDLIFCSALLQWCDMDQAFVEFHRVLKKDGVMLFSTFGPDTLKELRYAWHQVDQHIHVHDFIDMHHIGDALVKYGFELPVMDADYLTVTHQTVDTCLRDLKAIGANNAAQNRRRGLTSKQTLLALKRAYETIRNEQGLLETTYEIVYGQAWGSAQRQFVEADGSVSIPFSEIERSS